MSGILFKKLEDLSIPYTTYQHRPVFTIEQALDVANTIPGALCKNLFLKDKKGKFYLVVADHNTIINLKKLSKHIHAPELRFANPTDLKHYLDIEPGSVTPFALIHEHAQIIQVLVDQNLYKHTHAGFHPLHNSATTVIAVTDLQKFIAACGNQYSIIDFDHLGDES